MAEYKLAVIPGDGVGPEVIAEGRRVLEAVADSGAGPNFTYTQFPWGSDYYRETGLLMPEDGLQQLRAFDAILFGAVGDPQIPDHITLNGLLLPMRRYFDQGVCIRPSYLYPGVKSPLEGKKAGEIDLVIIRENTEGEYAPVGGRLYPGTPHEIVIQSNVFTRRGTERIIRAAFEYCVRRNKRNKVTSVTKSNAQAFGMVFWDEVFREVAEEYPQIETESLLVDRACMDLVRWPEAFDVMVASNLFADILSDIATVVHLFDNPNSVSGWMHDVFLKDFEDHVGESVGEDHQLISAHRLEPTGFFDEAVALKVLQGGPSGLISSTVVDFRVGRILGVAFVGTVGDHQRLDLAAELGLALERRIVRVVLGGG